MTKNIRLVHWVLGCGLIAFILFPQSATAGIVEFLPGIRVATEYDDNIRFISNDQKALDDFAASARPGFELSYITELLTFNSLAEVDVKKYLDETDFDRTNQLYQIGAEYRAHNRWTLSANGEFRKDETIDSQFEETGRVFERNRRERYEADGGVRYNLTELTDIGTTARYVRVDYGSDDDDDYDRYTFELPYRKKFQNQIDTLTLVPAYSRYNSDDGEEADDYRLTLGWEHLISETVTTRITAGARYTEIEDEDGKSDSNWGGVGSIGISKRGETFSGEARYLRDLRSNTDGEIIEVDRFFLDADKRLTERFGLRWNSNFYHSTTESQEADNDRVISFELTPAAYYMLTENHSIQLSYRYRREVELGESGNPTTNQNKVTLQLILLFPKRWD